MADSSLDDFFAKKDKKQKSKRKFTTTDQIAKKLEETGKKVTEQSVTKIEKEKPPTVPPTTMITQVVHREDDEWRDFEEEKEKDYSGLKIQNLQITETKEEEIERERIAAEDDEGEPFKLRDSGAGPWNKNTSTTIQIVEEPLPPPPVVEPEPKEEPKTGVYRPPHARTSTTPSITKSRVSSKTAPEISSELHFPSLSAAADNIKGSKKGDRTPDSDKGFESVKRGSRTNEEVVSRGPKLDLGNKYTALSHSDMS